MTGQLTTICQDTDDPADGECDERTAIFDDENRDCLWHYDNEGLKVAQLRFYPSVSTDLCTLEPQLSYCEQ